MGDDDGAELNLASGRRDAECAALMHPVHSQAHRDFIALCDHVFNVDVKIRESVTQVRVEGFKRPFAPALRVSFGETGRNCVGGAKLIDQIGPALIPDLIKPASDQGLVLVLD
jgi:hypothetical protein